jgi:hypothetical protein
MKLCYKHAETLRRELEQRDLGHLINHDLEKQAAIEARLKQGIMQGVVRAYPGDFDVWVLAQLMFAQEFAASLNPPRLIDAVPAALCPLCAVASKNTIIEHSWMRGACDELLEKAWAFGLMSHTKQGRSAASEDGHDHH